MRVAKEHISFTVSRLFVSLSLALMALLYLEFLWWQRPPGWGGDFDIFYAASSVYMGHGNPYDVTQLFARELVIFHPTGAWRAALPGEPYPQSPLLLTLLAPLLRLPTIAAYLVIAVLVGLSIVATLALLNHLYPSTHAHARLIALTISPPCLLGLHGGQIDALLLCAAISALLALVSCRPFLAGSLVSLSLIKPNIFIAVVVMQALLAYRRSCLRMFITGFACAGGIAVLLWSTIGGVGISAAWLRGMVSFSKGIARVLPSDPSLTTLYIGWAPQGFTVVVVASILCWIVTMALLWTRCRSPEAQMWWLMVGCVSWTIITPHAHEYDDILALPAVWWAWRYYAEYSIFSIKGLIRSIFWLCWIICPMTFLFNIDYHYLPVQGSGALPLLILLAGLALVAIRWRTERLCQPALLWR